VARLRIESRLHNLAGRDDLPLDVETLPAIVQACPGETVKVSDRVRNRGARSVLAFGRYEIAPSFAGRPVWYRAAVTPVYFRAIDPSIS
jgi:cytochrome c oxidase assembly protein Cox11